MSLLSETFVTDQVEDVSFDAIPAGKYIAQIVKAEIKTTKQGNGEYISAQWKIIEADDVRYNGRMIFQNFNISNPSDMAVKIGRSQLKQVTEAFGIAELHDTDELVAQNPVQITVKVRPAKDGYPEGNDITKVTSLDKIEGNSEDSDPWEE